MPEVPAVRAAEQPLIDAYRNAWARVVAEQDAIAADPIKATRAKRLAEMRSVIEDTMDEVAGTTRSWISGRLPEVYTAGGAIGAQATGAEFLWTTISQEAVQELAGSMFTELLTATEHVKDTTKALIRKIAQDEALQKAIEGRTAVQAGREMARLIADEGIHAVRYANGAKHGLGEYAEMVARTTTAKAYNYGVLNGAAQNGCEFWEVFDGPDCGWSAHDSGEQALGMIVTRDEALGFPISHPNCRRAFGPRPDLNATAKAGEGKGSVTPEQVAAQREQDAQRAAAQARRASRNRATATKRASRSPAARVEKRASRLAQRQAAPAPARVAQPVATRFDADWGGRGPQIARYDDGWTIDDGTEAMRASLEQVYQNGLPEGFRATIDVGTVGSSGTKLQFGAEIVDVRVPTRPRTVATMRRGYDSEKRSIYNSRFEVDATYQGQGMGTALLRELDNWYIAHGVESQTLLANIDVGGYAWARAGYDWNPADTDADFVKQFIKYEAQKSGHSAVFAEMANSIDPFADLVDVPTPYDIAMVGWEPGAKTWPGKELMLGSSWEGIRYLRPPGA